MACRSRSRSKKKYGKVGVKLDAAEFRQKCREYATEQIDLQRRDFKRLGVIGDWDNPYKTLDFRFEANEIRALAKVVDNGHLTRGVKPVHWCFDCGSALAEAEIEYADKVSPTVDIAYPARDPAAVAAAFGASLPAGVGVAVPIWTTTPWTLPASLAVSLGAELDYVLVEGPADRGQPRWLVIAEALAAKALARYGVGEVVVHGHAKGAALEHMLLNHPFYAEREIPLLLGDHVSAEDGTGAVHTAPGHGQEDYQVSKQYGLLERYGAAQINPVDGRGVYLPSTRRCATPCWPGCISGRRTTSSSKRCARPACCWRPARWSTATRIAGATRRRLRSVPRRSGSSRWSRPTCVPMRSRPSKTCIGIRPGARRVSPAWSTGARTGPSRGSAPGRADRLVRASRNRRAASAQHRVVAPGRRPRGAGRRGCLVHAGRVRAAE